MKVAVQSYIIGVLSLLCFFVATPALAKSETHVNVSGNDASSHTSVNVESNTGNNTICQNGKCTTTSDNGTSKSTVCHNGVCQTSEGGNIDFHSDDGHTTVTVHNNTNNQTATPTHIQDIKKEAEDKVEHAISHADDVKKEVEEEKEQADHDKDKVKAQIEEKKHDIEKKIESQKFDLADFLKHQFESFRKLIGFNFFFTNK